MKETFNLIEGRGQWKLGAVTPRREKLLSELGLVRENFDAQNENNVDKVLNNILSGMGDDLLKLLNGLFVGEKIELKDLEDLDKTEVKVAVFSFFLSDWKLLEQFGNLTPTLSSLK